MTLCQIMRLCEGFEISKQSVAEQTDYIIYDF